jgi:hypothetical protein
MARYKLEERATPVSVAAQEPPLPGNRISSIRTDSTQYFVSKFALWTPSVLGTAVARDCWRGFLLRRILLWRHRLWVLDSARALGLDQCGAWVKMSCRSEPAHRRRVLTVRHCDFLVLAWKQALEVMGLAQEEIAGKQ